MIEKIGRRTGLDLTHGGNVHVAMFRNQLSEVPELLPTTDQAIFLDGNHFHSLSALRASGNSAPGKNVIAVLPSGVFGHLSLLTQVYLQDNVLHTAQPNVFTGLLMMNELDLSNNRLAVLSAATVRELGMLPAM
ncbi:tsukushi-like [Dreissena polymorpha]|uniref:tsukushi-like n=1 Tax=Dreissena polymorpha TaxID=45954 RepID=UPI0022652DE8|nr:tsukushi-like [Dreissena polymorpha]